MRKNMKRTAALAMALGMAVTGSMAGYAAVDPAAAVPKVVDQVGADGTKGTKTELLGTIDVTSLSVTLPLKAGFNIDPGKFKEDSFTDQIGDNQSTEYKIINNSLVPVWVYISSVTTNKRLDDTTTDIQTDIVLTDHTTKLATSHSVMLAIKDKNAVLPGTPDSTADFWLADDVTAGVGQKYFLNDNFGELAAKTGVDGTEMQLKVYGLTKTGWKQGDKFAVTPTFMVSTTKPTV